MDNRQTQSKSGQPPLTYKLSKWYNFIFSAVFVIYGGVRIVLSVLDRNYEDMYTPIFFLLVGIVLVSICLAYSELKSWGWYGLLGVNALVVILSLFNVTQIGNIVLLVLSGATIYLMMLPATKSFVLSHR